MEIIRVGLNEHYKRERERERERERDREREKETESETVKGLEYYYKGSCCEIYSIQYTHTAYTYIKIGGERNR